MKKSTIAIIIAILSVGVIAGIYFFNQDEPSVSDTPAITNQTGDNSAQPSATTAASFTASEVTEHNTADDCWTIINSNVYDLTAYIPRHPGGQDEIIAACGKDGTSLFTERKTASGDSAGSGTPHSSGAASQLENLKIGTLSN